MARLRQYWVSVVERCTHAKGTAFWFQVLTEEEKLGGGRKKGVSGMTV